MLYWFSMVFYSFLGCPPFGERFDPQTHRTYLMLSMKVDEMSSIVMSFAMQGNLEMEDGFWNSEPYAYIYIDVLGGGFKYFFMFTPTWENDPI